MTKAMKRFKAAERGQDGPGQDEGYPTSLTIARTSETGEMDDTVERTPSPIENSPANFMRDAPREAQKPRRDFYGVMQSMSDQISTTQSLETCKSLAFTMYKQAIDDYATLADVYQKSRSKELLLSQQHLVNTELLEARYKAEVEGLQSEIRAVVRKIALDRANASQPARKRTTTAAAADRAQSVSELVPNEAAPSDATGVPVNGFGHPVLTNDESTRPSPAEYSTTEPTYTADARASSPNDSAPAPQDPSVLGQPFNMASSSKHPAGPRKVDTPGENVIQHRSRAQHHKPQRSLAEIVKSWDKEQEESLDLGTVEQQKAWIAELEQTQKVLKKEKRTLRQKLKDAQTTINRMRVTLPVHMHRPTANDQGPSTPQRNPGQVGSPGGSRMRMESAPGYASYSTPQPFSRQYELARVAPNTVGHAPSGYGSAAQHLDPLLQNQTQYPQPMLPHHPPPSSNHSRSRSMVHFSASPGGGGLADLAAVADGILTSRAAETPGQYVYQSPSHYQHPQPQIHHNHHRSMSHNQSFGPSTGHPGYQKTPVFFDKPSMAAGDPIPLYSQQSRHNDKVVPGSPLQERSRRRSGPDAGRTEHAPAAQ